MVIIFIIFHKKYFSFMVTISHIYPWSQFLIFIMFTISHIYPWSQFLIFIIFHKKYFSFMVTIFFQTLNSISSEKNHTIVFPFPVEMAGQLLGSAGDKRSPWNFLWNHLLAFLWGQSWRHKKCLKSMMISTASFWSKKKLQKYGLLWNHGGGGGWGSEGVWTWQKSVFVQFFDHLPSPMESHIIMKELQEELKINFEKYK